LKGGKSKEEKVWGQNIRVVSWLPGKTRKKTKGGRPEGEGGKRNGKGEERQKNKPYKIGVGKKQNRTKRGHPHQKKGGVSQCRKKQTL